MKRHSFIFISLLLFFYTMQAQVISPDTTIRKIFASLQAKDEKAFLSLCPDSAQLVRIMKSLAEDVIVEIEGDRSDIYSSDAATSLDRSLGKVRSILQKNYSPKEIKKLQNEFRNSFRSIIKDGEKRGVDWAGATLLNCTFDSAKNGNFLYHQTLYDRSGLRSMRGKIYFKDRDSTCQIWFSDLLFIPEENRWYAGTLIWLILPGDDVVEVTDVVVHSVEVEPPPPPPPPKPKKKTKISSIKKKPPKP